MPHYVASAPPNHGNRTIFDIIPADFTWPLNGGPKRLGQEDIAARIAGLVPRRMKTESVYGARSPECNGGRWAERSRTF